MWLLWAMMMMMAARLLLLSWRRSVLCKKALGGLVCHEIVCEPLLVSIATQSESHHKRVFYHWGKNIRRLYFWVDVFILTPPPLPHPPLCHYVPFFFCSWWHWQCIFCIVNDLCIWGGGRVSVCAVVIIHHINSLSSVFIHCTCVCIFDSWL